MPLKLNSTYTPSFLSDARHFYFNNGEDTELVRIFTPTMYGGEPEDLERGDWKWDKESLLVESNNYILQKFNPLINASYPIPKINLQLPLLNVLIFVLSLVFFAYSTTLITNNFLKIKIKKNDELDKFTRVF